jgi:hypothetical protein
MARRADARYDAENWSKGRSARLKHVCALDAMIEFLARDVAAKFGPVDLVFHKPVKTPGDRFFRNEFTIDAVENWKTRIADGSTATHIRLAAQSKWGFEEPFRSTALSISGLLSCQVRQVTGVDMFEFDFAVNRNIVSNRSRVVVEHLEYSRLFDFLALAST